MFGRKKYNLKMIRPTSKISLKSSCLDACKGNLEEAQKLYEYYMKDLVDIPDYDMMPKTTIEQVKEAAGSMVDWIRNNQDVIVTGFEMLQTMRSGGVPKPSVPTPQVPPIPNPLK